jgi:hypothetical protein
MNIALRHRGSGNIKFIDTGWSWSIFMGASFLGLPLFFRGLALWGTLMMVLWCLQVAVPFVSVSDANTLEWLVNIAIAGLCLYLGSRGNALSAKHFIACGYEFANPDSIEARIAAERWGI